MQLSKKRVEKVVNEPSLLRSHLGDKCQKTQYFGSYKC